MVSRGKLLLRIRFVQLDGQRLSVWNSFGRYGGYAASAIIGLTGFLQIYWDPNRQGLHDNVSDTAVIPIVIIITPQEPTGLRQQRQIQ